jgi:hypothetical protein
VPARTLVSPKEPSSTVSRREMRELIAHQLKANYDLAEPMPHRLVELLNEFAQRIEEQERIEG